MFCPPDSQATSSWIAAEIYSLTQVQYQASVGAKMSCMGITWKECLLHLWACQLPSAPLIPAARRWLGGFEMARADPGRWRATSIGSTGSALLLPPTFSLEQPATLLLAHQTYSSCIALWLHFGLIRPLVLPPKLEQRWAPDYFSCVANSSIRTIL